jgi:phosphoadenosine phosphosulfate reductase
MSNIITERTLFDFVDKEKTSMDRLRHYEPPEGYWLAFSGGKDSIVLYDIAKRSGVKFEAHFKMTSVDPKELLMFIKKNYPDVIWHKPVTNMWKLIEKHGIPPTRMIRYCCRELKEETGHADKGRFILTGVRWAESVKRRGRKMVDICLKDGQKNFLHPIIDWKDSEIWKYIRHYNIPYCELYDQGFTRIGCIGCPMSSAKKRKMEFIRWPHYKKAYLNAYARMIKAREERGLEKLWDTPEQVMAWNMEEYKIHKGPPEPTLYEY